MKLLFFAFSLIWNLQGALAGQAAQPLPSQTTHCFSVFGDPKYPEIFTHFDYTNPDAPKGGMLRLGGMGTFDSLNPYVVKGTFPIAIGLTTATLLEQAEDRSGESYAYAAESMELAPDQSWVIFHLNPKATFNNGDPVTADDVIWVFETLKTKGMPLFRTYYKDIHQVEKLDVHTVKFVFSSTTNRELPGILGQLPILSKKYYETHEFVETSLAPPPTSGPYEIESLSPGHSITYRRVKDWWGTKIPSQKGRHNFDHIKVDYYLELNALFEGFKAGQYDLRQENIAKNWAMAYGFPAVKKGYIKQEELTHSLSSGTQGFYFNTRRFVFSDRRVRKALTLLFNFTWINKHLLYGLYERNTSYYPNSDFESKNLPTLEERAILKPFRDRLPLEIFDQAFTLPAPQTENDQRILLAQAQSLLKDAGYEVQNDVMTNIKTGEPLTFEFLIFDKAIEKIVLNFAQSLKRIGILLKVRNLDITTYQLRETNLDFDMIYDIIPQSSALGNEQRDYFGSERANMPGTRNYAGIHDPVIDRLIEELIHAKGYPSLVAHSKALDRVLLRGYYMIPTWHSPTIRIAYWNRFSRPSIVPKYRGLDITTWWFDPAKDAKLPQKKQEKGERKNSEGAFLWEKLKRLFS